jgi:hypothetical protein
MELQKYVEKVLLDVNKDIALAIQKVREEKVNCL